MPFAELLKKRPGKGPKMLFPSQRREQQEQQRRQNEQQAAQTPRKRSLPLQDISELDECRDVVDGAKSLSLEDEVLGTKSCKLARSLSEVLSDNTAMTYFVQYLEARDAVNLVKFLLDVRSFKASVPQNGHSETISQNPDVVEPTPSSSSTGIDSRETFKKDAVEIYHRFLAPDCSYPIHLGVDETHKVVKAICTEEGNTVEISCFEPAEQKVLQILEAEYFREFMLSDCYAKYQVEVLTSSPVTMSDVLYNDTLLFHFMEFMEIEGDRDLLEFWISVNNFRENTKGDHLKEDALVIYERFISLQATSPLGFNNNLRSRLEEAICSEEGVKATCFDPALTLVIRVLQRRYLAKFIESSLYRKFLQELLTQVQNSPFGKCSNPSNSQAGSGGSRKKSTRSNSVFSGLRRSSSNVSLSTCSSSEVSISTQNTLLAMSKGKSEAQVKHSFSDSLLDPSGDSLWQRKHHSVINIGQIDHLGRYKSSFEQPPENPASVSGVSKVTQAMKRLVSQDMDQVQEDMAWQMAAMIVKDVTDMTSPTSLSPPSLCGQDRDGLSSDTRNSSSSLTFS